MPFNKTEANLGIYKIMPITCIDKHNLFIRSGVNVIAGFAGEGKSTYIIELSKQWKKDGYAVAHINFDLAPTYNAQMLNPPISSEGLSTMFSTMKAECNDNDILIIDSLKAMVSIADRDIESNKAMLPMMYDLRQLCNITGMTIILIHHVYSSKLLKTPVTHFSGSRAIEEQCDSGFIYTDTSIKIIKSRAGYRRDEQIKI